MGDDYAALGATLFALGYLGLFFLARWHWITWPTRLLLLAKMRALRVHLQNLGAQAPAAAKPTDRSPGEPDRTDRILSEINKLISEVEGPPPLRAYIHGNAFFLFYWRVYHELEAETIRFDLDAERKWACSPADSLLQVPADLRQVRDLENLRANLSKKACREGDMEGGDERDIAGKSNETVVASFVYDFRDSYYQRLADWHNKALWLVIMALALIVMIVVLGGPLHILLAGGLGGLLAKLRGAILRADVPTDYGVSWTTLFLTPLIGSLTGWGGIQLTHLVWRLDLLQNVLPKALCEPDAAVGLAILFGYSASIFNKLFEQAQSRLMIKELP